MIETPPWGAGPAVEDPVAGRFDVVVIGASVAGLVAAHRLAADGAQVAVLEAGPSVGAQGAARAPGHALLGLAGEPAFRLAHAIGDEATAEIYRFTKESLDFLHASGLVRGTGGAWMALDAREPTELGESLAVLRRLGVRAEWWSADHVQTVLGLAAPGAALHFPDELRVDPAEALAELVSRARAVGVRVRCGVPITAIEEDAGGVVVHVGPRQVRAEAAVLAGGAGLMGVVPFLEGALAPHREHACAAPDPGTAPVVPVRAGYGYVGLVRASSGHLIARGVRWATAHLEIGETEERTIPAVQARLDAVLARHAPGAGAPTHRWAWVEVESCDGLPLVGPLPGSPRVVLCTAFGGNPWGLGPRAGIAVADGLRDGRAPGVPAGFHPARMA